MQREGVDPRRPARHDTLELRTQLSIVTDDTLQEQSDEEDGEMAVDDGSDISSELSVPDESINFDLVYAIRTFAATVDGQANVFKGDSLVLMDDSNSYWWLVQVLKTSEIGYIPAEIIETPLERLARLNKHRNEDIARPTDRDHNADPHVGSRSGVVLNQRVHRNSGQHRSVFFTESQSVHTYPPAVWKEEDMEDEEEYEDEDGLGPYDEGAFEDADESGMEPDDGMDWHRDVASEVTRRAEPQATQPSTSIHAQAASLRVQTNEADARDRLAAAVQDIERRSPSRESFHQSRTPTPQSASASGPLLPSAILQQESGQRPRGNALTPQQGQGGEQLQRRSSDRRVLRKQRSVDSNSTEEEPKKKKGGMFSSLFGRKGRDKARTGSVDSDSLTRSSEDTYQSQPDSKHSSISSITGVAAAQARTSIPPALREPHARYPDQYLTHSPMSSTQSSSAMTSPSSSTTMSPDSARRPRPGSLILSPGAVPNVPDLNVMRIFAGDDVRVEATFKTVLVNSSTTATDLVKQALQRFHIRDANPDEFYITVKRLSEGGSAALRPDELPLAVFEQLVEAAQMARIPKVKRTSVGSISSLASNLSMHPAIAGLGMNDYADDSAVRFYLNRSGRSVGAFDEDLTLTAEEFEVRSPRARAAGLSIDVLSATTVTPERFTSPTARFALHLFIFPEDLPASARLDDSRSRSQMTNQRERRKVLLIPANTTVAEVIELGLDRFGITEGVVDGGDEVEDKVVKRGSQSRVRYNLAVKLYGSNDEHELLPTRRVLDAFPRSPKFMSSRHDRDGPDESTQLEDPTFILRRATKYRQAGSRSRLSASLDEVELQHRRSASVSSTGSSSGPASGLTLTIEDHTIPRTTAANPMSRQELIAAQREASRANQRAILSAQNNSERGVDIMLPNRALLRSSRLGPNTSAAVRYSYVEPDGETYDIGQLLEDEWREEAATGPRGDLLKGAVDREGLINRVISKIKDGKRIPPSSSTSDDKIGTRTPPDSDTSFAFSTTSSTSRYSSASSPQTPVKDSRSSTPTVDGRGNSRTPINRHAKQSSVASAESTHSSSYESSGPSTPATMTTAHTANNNSLAPGSHRAPLILRETDFGVSRMIARIELAAATNKPNKHQPPRIRSPYEDLDIALFGPQIDLRELHPSLREVYQDTFRQLDDLDQKLDSLLQSAMRA